MMTSSSPHTDDQSGAFVMSRVFDAPRDLVWKAFTDPERMRAWWGPKGFTVIAMTLDLRVGGTYHYGLKAPNGAVMWGKFVYREIVPPEHIVVTNFFSDEAGGVTRHPMSATWPLQLQSTFSFEKQPGGKTKLTVRSLPHDATEEERKTFESSLDGMRQGWSGTMDQLAGYLAGAR